MYRSSRKNQLIVTFVLAPGYFDNKYYGRRRRYNSYNDLVVQFNEWNVVMMSFQWE